MGGYYLLVIVAVVVSVDSDSLVVATDR